MTFQKDDEVICIDVYKNPKLKMNQTYKILRISEQDGWSKHMFIGIEFEPGKIEDFLSNRFVLTNRPNKILSLIKILETL